MGYTHYWRRPPELGASTFGLFAHDAKQLAIACEIPIAFEYDAPEQPPHFGGDEVRFNGISEDGHETFCIPQVMEQQSWQSPDENGRLFDFCKTARKPYDVLACAILIAFKHHFGDQVEVSSDGSWNGYSYEYTDRTTKEMRVVAEREWLDGRHLYRRVFPERDTETSMLSMR